MVPRHGQSKSHRPARWMRWAEGRQPPAAQREIRSPGGLAVWSRRVVMSLASLGRGGAPFDPDDETRQCGGSQRGPAFRLGAIPGDNGSQALENNRPAKPRQRKRECAVANGYTERLVSQASSASREAAGARALRRRRMDCVRSWETRDSVRPSTWPISFRFSPSS